MTGLERTNKAFQMGFDYGKSHHKEITPRQVSELHPELFWDEIDAFIEGMEDGISGSTWRLNRINGKEEG